MGTEEHQGRRPAVGESRAEVLLYIPELSRASVVYQPNMGHK